MQMTIGNFSNAAVLFLTWNSLYCTDMFNAPTDND